VEKKFIVVAYGDIVGYTSWSKQVLNPAESRESFMTKFYDELGWFVLSSDFRVKYLGDGFMILRELPQKGRRIYDCLRFLFGIHKLTTRIKDLIKESDFPPKGFRIRVVAGAASKTYMPDPNAHDRQIEEYSSPAINLSAKLLHVEPQNMFICHGSVVSLIGHGFPGVKFKRLKNLNIDPHIIDIEDANNLWTFSFDGVFHIA